MIDIIYVKRYLIIINCILLAVAIYLGGDISYRLVTEKSVITPPRLSNSQPLSTGNDAKHHDLSYYNTIARRNLFNLKSEMSSPVKPITIDNLKQTDLKLKLWGTIIGSGNKDYAVIESNGGDQNLYHVGDAIQNATIKMILREKVVLSVNGTDEILEMAELPSKASASTPALPRRKSVSKVSQSRIPLKRSQIEDATQNIPQMLEGVNIRPHFESGKPSGLMLSRIKPNSIFRKMRLMNGDILKEVDGKPILSVDDALKAYESLRSSDEVKIEIKRRGRDQTIVYTIE